MGFKDLLTTILAVATGWLYYAMSQNMQVPLISGYRAAIITLTLIGIAMCALSGGGQGASNAFITIASVLGGISLIFIIIGLITGAKIIFTLLAGTILLLWLVSTTRHIFLP